MLIVIRTGTVLLSILMGYTLLVYAKVEQPVPLPLSPLFDAPDRGLSLQKAPLHDEWTFAESKAQNAVVQIIAQIGLFNWLDPYRAPEVGQSAGTGFFISHDGLILTNFHVMQQAKTAWIHIPALGRRLLPVERVGVCPEADVALLRLTGDALEEVRQALGKISVLELGDSDALYPTEPVLALGYPLGERYLKRTTGVFAGREYIMGQSYMHITAPINPGNSGGPLLNRNGYVVGINSAGIERAQSIGYIVPINDVKILLKDLAITPLLRKPHLGVSFNGTTAVHAESLGNPVPAGMYINFVGNGSLAQQLGLAEGDMLYKINDYAVDQYGDVTVNWRSSDKVAFSELLIRLAVNTPLSLTVYRKGKKIELSGTFEDTNIHPIRTIFPEFESSSIGYEMIGGMCVMQLRENHFELLPDTTLLHSYKRYKKRQKQVLVITSLLPGSEITKVHCFYPGLLIDKINDQEVTTLDELREALFSSVRTGFISIRSKEGIATVVSLEKVLRDEPRLARDFMFPISPTVQKLIHANKDSYAYPKD